MSAFLVPGQWRTTWAALAWAVWLGVFGYWLIDSPLLWLLRLFGPFQWGTIST